MIRSEVQTLPSGLDVVCVSQPHWKTAAARFVVQAGSLHEKEEQKGVAHFFEHVAFQGTSRFSSVEEILDFTNERSIYMNAYTTPLETCFMANGFDAEDAVKVVTELGLRPNITPETLERERGAILEEARGERFSIPRANDRKRHERIGGENYGRLGIGTDEEIKRIRPEDMITFYNEHYTAENAMLIICSGDDPKQQLETAIEYTEQVLSGADKEPTPINLEWMHTDGTTNVDTAMLDAPAESLSHIELDYANDIPPHNLRSSMVSEFAGRLVGKSVHRLLRTHYGIAYSPNAGSYDVRNRNYGGNGEVYSAMTMNVGTSGDNIVNATNILRNEVPEHVQMGHDEAQRILRTADRTYTSEMEQVPSYIADTLLRDPAIIFDRAIDQDRKTDLVREIHPDELVAEALRMIDREPDVAHMSSPDVEILDAFSAIWSPSTHP